MISQANYIKNWKHLNGYIKLKLLYNISLLAKNYVQEHY